MADKKKSGTTRSRGKPVIARQKTLLDLFPRKTNSVVIEPDEGSKEAQDLVDNLQEVAAPTDGSRAADTISTGAVVEKLRLASLEPKALHPFFTMSAKARAEQTIPADEIIEVIGEDNSVDHDVQEISDISPNASQEGGSQQDPIILDTTPLKFTRIRQYDTSKPVAPLFLPKKAAKPVKPSIPKSRSAASLDAPYPDKYSQHVRGQQQAFISPVIPYGRRRKIHSLDAEVHAGPVIRSNASDAFGDTHTPGPSQFVKVTTLTDDSSFFTSIPEEDRQHPALSRLEKTKTDSAHAHRLWTDKWHPTCADEVLGNESNALYLRDWLRALELHLESTPISTSSENFDKAKGKGKAKADVARGSKRPRVIRAVEKRRGRKKRRVDSDDEDGWIAYSDEPEEDTYSLDEFDDDLDEGPVLSQLHRKVSEEHLLVPPVPTVPNHSFDPLTNTILLTGPSGTGKTAAAYACAEELGWEVFEVYPGIGKRSGAGIENLIGDVGKNHLVRKTRAGDADSSAKGANALTAHFGKAESGNKPAEMKPVDTEDPGSTSSRDFGFISPHDANTSDATPNVRQSMILLEEVDILFKEDANFWPAVTNFIKDCKRPVICTCNDISLVPTLDLPLQATLGFQPCPSPLAASYLQALCYAEGYEVERATLLALYESTFELNSVDLPDSPHPPMISDFPVPDLRRTIHQLQFQCSSADSESEYTSRWELEQKSVEDLCDWTWPTGRPRKSADGSSGDQPPLATVSRTNMLSTSELAVNHADLISFVDSHLIRGPLTTSEALAWNSCEPSADDEVGHPILFSSRTTTTSFGPYDRDDEIASTAVLLSRGALEFGMKPEPTPIGINSFRTRELFRARVDHQVQIAEALGSVVPLSVLTVRRSEVCIDYLPCVRDIVGVEDEQEEKQKQKERSGRMTRNSGGVYVRTLVLTTEAREALDRTGLESQAQG
ncbi:ATPase family AAA domain-containing protein 5 [Hypsizygus marmoreus]|uniref:ATPase family AAA domain-containing protein 5 n=1 Tax=Hypsizygus marmoreus TaxID=39966 RepID=A0A369JS50_HYPMA|nr:ATPase family AAA domain-containing protein 5 [Hypsizygus marmoreus]